MLKGKQIWEDELTALDGVGCSLQGHRSPRRLIDVNPENHPHACVLTPDVSLPLPQLDVRVAQLQDPGAVDPAICVETCVRWTALPNSSLSTRQISMCIDDIYTLGVNQAVIYTSVRPNQKWFSLWDPSTKSQRRLKTCQQKINTTTPNRAFTPQCTHTWVKFNRNKWMGTFRRWFLLDTAPLPQISRARIDFSRCQSLHQTLHENLTPLSLSLSVRAALIKLFSYLNTFEPSPNGFWHFHRRATWCRIPQSLVNVNFYTHLNTPWTFFSARHRGLLLLAK